MLCKNNDDASSSEDEISKDALREATDLKFFKNTYLSATKSEVSDTSNRNCDCNNSEYVNDSTNVQSLRKNLEENNQFENFGVSPSFQNYVAKKLDEIIEKSIRIKEKKRNGSVDDNKETTDTNSGIKLLNSSIEFLTTAEETEEPYSPPKRRKTEVIKDDKANLLKCKQVAVDPEWVLSKEETKAWTSRKKGPDFKYKRLKNGTLVEET